MPNLASARMIQLDTVHVLYAYLVSTMAWIGLGHSLATYLIAAAGDAQHHPFALGDAANVLTGCCAVMID
jgi:hypothetical protein